MKKLQELTDKQLAKLVENRWNSSETVWDIVKKTYDINLRYYKSNPDWLDNLPRKQPRVRTNRIFTNMESVINALIANPPQPNILPGRDTPEAKNLATDQEKFFQRKYKDLNVKETLRKGLRNLYLSRLIVIKPFWDAKINDFNARAIDPRKVRIAKSATKEDDSEFAIEEVTDYLLSLMRRFPAKKADIMKEAGYSNEEDVLINNPEVVYKEAWIRDFVVFKYNNIILGKVPNPYWDWDGILLTAEEEQQIATAEGEQRRNILQGAKDAQEERKAQMAATQGPQMPPEGEEAAPMGEVPQAPPIAAPIGQETGQNGDTGTLPLEEYQDTPQQFSAYYFNHFNHPRKPYIIATAFNNENTPIGQTDMISQAIPLQADADETKRNITRNARFVNGVWKIDSTVMVKADAQKLDTETGGIVYGKGVSTGATRETGEALPGFVMENYRDSLAEIDNIMAASSAFRGEREGQETKAGRLALIEQSFLRLNELVQIVDYVNYELFNWFYQLAKVRYTEHHYAKTMGKGNANEILTLIQDDLEDGTEVQIVGGKSLPEDRQFRFEQAQADVQKGIIAPEDYFEAAGYDNPQELAKNKVLYDLNPALATGVTEEELAQYQPPKGPEEKPPSVSIAYKDLPIDGQVQLAAQIGITLDPNILIAEKQAEAQKSQQEARMKLAGRGQPPDPRMPQ